MEKYLEVLKRCSLFKDVEEQNLSAMLDCLGVTIKKYNKRETIFAEGEDVKYIGIVLSGSAQIEQTDFWGNRSIVTKVLPGEIFGESFACADVKKMPVNVTATEETEIMFVDCFRITHSCSNACLFHQQIIYNLIRVVATKNLVFHQKIEITSKRTTREKLMTYLLMQAKEKGSNVFEIPYDRQGLADYLEVDRSGLSAEISKLRNEGVLRNKRNYFELLNMQ